MYKIKNDSAQTIICTDVQPGTARLPMKPGLLASLRSTLQATFAFFSHATTPPKTSSRTTPAPEEYHFLNEQEATAFAQECISRGYWAEVQQDMYDYSWSVECAPVKPE